MLTVASWAAVYFIVWWTTLFAVLPFGARSQTDAGEVTPGTDPGAPERPRIGRIVLTTTAVATVIFAVIYWVLTQNVFGLEDIPFLPKFEKVG